MSRVTIEFDWEPLLSALDSVFVQTFHKENWAMLFPNTLQQIGKLAREGTNIWKDRAVQLPGQEGRPLQINPYVKLSIPDYAASIQESPVDSSGLKYVVGTTEQQAEFIEFGAPEIDLHDVLSTSIKARRGKKGRYLRIPFRHATTTPGGSGGQRFQAAGARPGQGVLTSGVMRAMAAKPRYLRIGYLGRVASAVEGKTIRHFAYSPAKVSQLTAKELVDISQRALKHKLTETEIKHLTGLMHVGRKGQGSYLTIRTLSESNPDGWRIPEYKPKKVAAYVVKKLNELVESKHYFDEAMRADARHIAQLARVT